MTKFNIETAQCSYSAVQLQRNVILNEYNLKQVSQLLLKLNLDIKAFVLTQKMMILYIKIQIQINSY
jgi:hypothetical protein